MWLRHTWIALTLGVGLTACAPSSVASSPNLASRPVRVATTTGMVADVVKNIGAGRVEVVSLMGPGVDPHLYKPSSGDVLKLDRADVIFYNGLHLEGRMAELFEKMTRAGKPAFAVTGGIDPTQLRALAGSPGHYDPHVWFDVRLWQDAARFVAQVLSDLDPASRELYEHNAELYLEQLDELQAYAEQRIALIPPGSRVLITSHDAFGYFGRRYGFEVRGLQGVSTAAEAGARDVQELAALIADRKIKAIFVESSVPPDAIEAVQAAVRARGWDVVIGGELFSDALGADGTLEGTYIGMFKHNVDTIVGALRGPNP
ncbi:MAG: manganese transporter [Candidatus Thermofonsia Clade 3 bacterium]|uniref:Manganese transporter n=2 Tax=Candidatus Thermofonsia Clade 3 TaxID=2364209 RepID=A0A2M8QFC7_9CHLR|nr:MAG: manganese transporter [Candidatus Thermofonsia Clade 3 bacterium]